MHRLASILALAVASTALSAQGTSTPTPQQTRVPTAADSAVMRVLELPRILQRARAAGARDTTVQDLMDIIRRRGIPPEEAIPAIELEVETIEAGGNRDNFGAFVRAQVESGLRGRELAEAIRAEKQARGMGRPQGAGAQGRGGRPEGAGPPAAGRRPETTQPQPRGGRPEQAGPPSTRVKAPSRDSTPTSQTPPRGRRP